MITGLRLGNFKAFGETQHIPIKPITLIFGANSSGKSSIIHSLLLSRHAQQTGNLNVYRPNKSGGNVDLGGFRQYVHRRNPSHQVTFGFSIKLPSDRKIWNFSEHERGRHASMLNSDWDDKLNLILENATSISADIQFGLETSGNVPEIISYSVSSDGTLLGKIRRMHDGKLHRESTSFRNRIYAAFWEFLKEKEELITSTASFQTRDPRDEYASFLEQYASQEATASPASLAIGHYSGNFMIDNFRDSQQHWQYEKERAEFDLYQSGLELAALSDRYERKDLLQESQEEVEVWKEKVKSGEGMETYFSLKSMGYESELKIESAFFEAVCAISSFLAVILNDFDYIGPYRFLPPRTNIPMDKSDREWYMGGYEWQLLTRYDELRQAVNRWLSDEHLLQTPYELITRRYATDDHSSDIIEELALLDKRFNTIVSCRDVGFGISQVLPVLVSAYASEQKIVAIEQPEIHLHPALQAELGDVFIKSALGDQKNTFLLETHSEHLILRIMRRMRDTLHDTLPEGMPPVRPEDVAVLYVQRKPDGSSSEVIEIELDEEGQLLTPWPGGFFEEGFRERFA